MFRAVATLSIIMLLPATLCRGASNPDSKVSMDAPHPREVREDVHFSSFRDTASTHQIIGPAVGLETQTIVLLAGHDAIDGAGMELLQISRLDPTQSTPAPASAAMLVTGISLICSNRFKQESIG